MALVVAACGGSSSVIPRVVSSSGTVGLGTQRILVALIDQATQEFVSSPDLDASVVLRNENGAPLGEYPTEFVYTVPGVRGLYASYVDIPSPGTYQVTVKSAELGETLPAGLFAVEDPKVISAGDAAPRSETRTSAEYEISEITSDPSPEPAFYEMSVAEAIQRGPTVVVFASPGFCSSGACRPLLDRVKELAPRFPGVNFVHVEIYEDISVQSVDELVPVEAAAEWRLPSEPWVFVVDDRGIVSAAFEGSASEEELRGAISAVAP